ASIACRPKSPNATVAPRVAMPVRRPRCILRYLTRFGISIWLGLLLCRSGGLLGGGLLLGRLGLRSGLGFGRGGFRLGLGLRLGGGLGGGAGSGAGASRCRRGGGDLGLSRRDLGLDLGLLGEDRGQLGLW